MSALKEAIEAPRKQIRMDPDGDCALRALEGQRRGISFEEVSPEMLLSARKTLVEYIRRHENTFLPYCVQDSSNPTLTPKQEFQRRMEVVLQPRSFIGEEEFAAYYVIFQVNIIVYQFSREPYVFTYHEDNPSLGLFFDGVNHYDAYVVDNHGEKTSQKYVVVSWKMKSEEVMRLRSLVVEWGVPDRFSFGVKSTLRQLGFQIDLVVLYTDAECTSESVWKPTSAPPVRLYACASLKEPVASTEIELTAVRNALPTHPYYTHAELCNLNNVVDRTSPDSRFLKVTDHLLNIFNIATLPSPKGIYERQAYLDLYTFVIPLIWKALSATRPHDVRMVLVTGVPGIGKSAFKVALAKEILRFNPMLSILLLTSSTEGTLISSQRPDEAMNVITVTGPLMDHGVVKFLDFKKKEELSAASDGPCIIFSSPDNARFKESIKGCLPKMKFLMPVWTYSELLELQSGSSLDAVAFEDRYSKFGGVPRLVFSLPDDRIEQLFETALNTVKLEDIIKVQGYYPTNTTSYTLVHLQSPDYYLTNATCYFASQYARERFQDRLMQHHFEDAWKVIFDKSASGQTVLGQLFEPIAHRLLVRLAKRIEITKLEPLPSEDCGIDNPLKADMQLELTSKKNFDKLEYLKASDIVDGVLLVPYSHIFPTVDSFAVIGNQLFLFQCTVGVTHGIKQLGINLVHRALKKLLPSLSDHPIFVFICPWGDAIQRMQKIEVTEETSRRRAVRYAAASTSNVSVAPESKIEKEAHALSITLANEASAAGLKRKRARVSTAEETEDDPAEEESAIFEDKRTAALATMTTPVKTCYFHQFAIRLKEIPMQEYVKTLNN